MGLNVDTAMFTITVASTAEEVQQLLQRLNQFEKVRAALPCCDQGSKSCTERAMVTCLCVRVDGAGRHLTLLVRASLIRFRSSADRFVLFTGAVRGGLYC